MGQHRMSKSNIEILLSEWGAWKRGENRRALGFPSQAAFHNVVVDGSGKVPEPDVLLVDDDLERLDRCISALFPEARRIIVAHYIWTGPVKAKLDKLGVSRTMYYDMVANGQKQLAHWMGEGYGVPDNYFVRTACATVQTKPQ